MLLDLDAHSLACRLVPRRGGLSGSVIIALAQIRVCSKSGVAKRQ